MSNFPIAIVVALLPGILATLTIKKLTLSGNWDNFKIGLYTVVYSGIVYALYFLMIDLIWDEREFADSSIDGLISNIKVLDVVLSSLLSLIVGIAVSAASNHKILFTVVNFLKITKKFGDEDLYYDFLRNDDNNEVYVKDIENNVVYHGVVTGYSQGKETRELELSNVDVYSYEDSKFFYQLRSMYIAQGIGERFQIEVSHPIETIDDLTEREKTDTTSVSDSEPKQTPRP